MSTRLIHSAIRNVLIGLFAGSLLLVGQETTNAFFDASSLPSNELVIYESLIIFYVLFFVFYFELFRLFHSDSTFTQIIAPRVAEYNNNFIGLSCFLVSLSLLVVAFLPIVIIRYTSFFFVVVCLFVTIDAGWSYYVIKSLTKWDRKYPQVEDFINRTRSWFLMDIGFGSFSFVSFLLLSYTHRIPILVSQLFIGCFLACIALIAVLSLLF